MYGRLCFQKASTPFHVVFSGHWIRPEIPQERNDNVVDSKRIIPSLQHYLPGSPQQLRHGNRALKQVKLGLWLQDFGRVPQHTGWCSLVLLGIQQQCQVPVLIILIDTSWPANGFWGVCKDGEEVVKTLCSACCIQGNCDKIITWYKFWKQKRNIDVSLNLGQIPTPQIPTVSSCNQ